MNIEKLSWFFARLRVMNFAEIAHRVKESATKGFLTLFPKAPQAISSRIKPIGEHYDQGATWLGDCPESGLNLTFEDDQGPVIFGRHWPLRNGEIRWHASLSGENFEKIRSFRVNYRSKEQWSDDIRQIWELNRLVWLLPVAKFAAENDNKRALAQVKDVINSFLEADKPGYSTRWNSTIELAIQSLSLLGLEKILGPLASEALPESYLKALQNRLRWLEGLPSKHSSANNHRVAELVAIIAIRDRLIVKRRKEKVTPEELSTLALSIFADDGFTTEQSFGYHLFTLDLFATGLALVPTVKLASPAAARLALAAGVVRQIYEFCGFWPSANDGDEAQIFGVLESQKSPPLFLHRAVFDEADVVQLDPDVIHLSKSGYIFLKARTEGAEFILLVDHGPIGLPPIFAHGHADMQSIWLWVNRESILVEAGTYCYHSSPAIRKILQGSTSHNSISIDGQSIVEPRGPFLWFATDLPSDSHFNMSRGESGFQIRMECTAPARHLEIGHIIWIRELKFSELGLQIQDTTIAPKNHQLSSQLVFTPTLELVSTLDDGFVLSSNAYVVEVVGEAFSSNSEFFEVAPTYSHLEIATRLQFSSAIGLINSVTTNFRFRLL